MKLISAREALHRLNISLHELANAFTHANDNQLVLLKVSAGSNQKTAQITGINLMTNTLSYQPVHIYFNEDGRREIVPVKENNICSLDDKVFF